MADTPPAPTIETATPQQPPVVVKKYANRRLYNTETSSYITLDNLAEMIRAGRDFVVYDAKSGEDITRGVLTQIIVEEESKGSSLLPTNFLRQLIGFYGGNMQGVVPNYLDQAMSSFARQQHQMRQVVQQTFGPFMPAGVEEMSRQNMALLERAMSMWNPFHRQADPARGSEAGSAAVSGDAAAGEGAKGDGAKVGVDPDEAAQLRREVESLRAQLAIARAEAVMIHAPLAVEAAPVQAPNVVADPKPAVPMAVARRQRTARKLN